MIGVKILKGNFMFLTLTTTASTEIVYGRTIDDPNLVGYVQRITKHILAYGVNTSRIFLQSGNHVVCNSIEDCLIPGATFPQGDQVIYSLEQVLVRMLQTVTTPLISEKLIAPLFRVVNFAQKILQNSLHVQCSFRLISMHYLIGVDFTLRAFNIRSESRLVCESSYEPNFSIS